MKILDRKCSVDLSIYTSGDDQYQDIESMCNEIEFVNLTDIIDVVSEAVVGTSGLNNLVAYPIIYINNYPLYPVYSYLQPTAFGILNPSVFTNNVGQNRLVIKAPDAYSLITDPFKVRVVFGGKNHVPNYAHANFILGIKKLSYQDSDVIKDRYDRMNEITGQRSY